MNAPTARDLLAQADRLMRQRSPEELPVLTDLVLEEIDCQSLPDRMDEVLPTQAKPSGTSASQALPQKVPNAVPPPIASPFASAVLASAVAQPTAQRTATVAAAAPSALRAPQESAGAAAFASGPNTQSALANVRLQFNEQLLAKMEELQHSVFSQVMQKLEVNATGSLKAHLRQTLEPALIGIARDLAEQVAEDTANQVRQVVSDAVDTEIARLREQFSKKRI